MNSALSFYRVSNFPMTTGVRVVTKGGRDDGSCSEMVVTLGIFELMTDDAPGRARWDHQLNDRRSKAKSIA